MKFFFVKFSLKVTSTGRSFSHNYSLIIHQLAICVNRRYKIASFKNSHQLCALSHQRKEYTKIIFCSLGVCKKCLCNKKSINAVKCQELWPFKVKSLSASKRVKKLCTYKRNLRYHRCYVLSHKNILSMTQMHGDSNSQSLSKRARANYYS